MLEDADHRSCHIDGADLKILGIKGVGVPTQSQPQLVPFSSGPTLLLLWPVQTSGMLRVTATREASDPILRAQPVSSAGLEVEVISLRLLLF